MLIFFSEANARRQLVLVELAQKGQKIWATEKHLVSIEVCVFATGKWGGRREERKGREE